MCERERQRERERKRDRERETYPGPVLWCYPALTFLLACGRKGRDLPSTLRNELLSIRSSFVARL